MIRKEVNKQAGFLQIELLVAFTALSIVGLGVSYSMVSVFKNNITNKRGYAVIQVAEEKMASYAVTNPELLDNTYDGSEFVSFKDIQYEVTTDVTVLANRSREVEVTVVKASDPNVGKITITNSFALWGKR